MRFRLRSFYVAVLLASASATAMAAPATPEGAAKITSALQPYVGAKADVLTVTPSGEAYDIKLDMVKMLPRDKLGDVTLEISPFVYKAVDQGGGKWLVTMDQPLAFLFKASGIDLEGSIGRLQSNCQFDEAIQTCASSSRDMTDVDVNEVFLTEGQSKSIVNYTVKSIHSEMTATANSAGGIDVTFVSFGSDFVEKITNVASPEGMPVEVNLTVKNFSSEAKLSQLQIQALNRLWIWFVANSAGLERIEDIKTAVVAKQDELKTLVRAALPLFQNVSGGSVYHTIEATTPVGMFSLDKVRADIDMNGFVADGKLSEVIEVEGFKAPAGLVPEFASGLVPSKLRLDFNLKDFNLDALARLLLDVDFEKGPPVGQDFPQKLKEALLPTGSFTIFSKDSGVTAEAFNLTTDNNLVITPHTPKPVQLDSLTKMTGLDKVIDIVIKAPPSFEPQRLTPLLLVLKGMGKQESDGSIIWKTEIAPDGQILVNGTDVKKMMSAPN